MLLHDHYLHVWLHVHVHASATPYYLLIIILNFTVPASLEVSLRYMYQEDNSEMEYIRDSAQDEGHYTTSAIVTGRI